MLPRRRIVLCLTSMIAASSVAGHAGCSQTAKDGGKHTTTSPKDAPAPTPSVTGSTSPAAARGAADAAPTVAADPDAVSPPPAALVRGLRLERVATKLSRPVGIEAAPGDTGRLFVVEQVGTIRILRGTQIDPGRVLDIRSKVSRANEQGLLGLAFHPAFQTNKKLYVNYTDKRRATHVVEYKLTAADRVDPSTARELLRIDQPYANHNGGGIEFGPDGKLYVGMGDGGAANDPHKAGQNPNTLLAKMLRIDVDVPGAKPELVHMGLRNPWRFTFDRKTGDLYIADVGQALWEEVDVVAGDDSRKHNFGWNQREGRHCFSPAKGCKSDGMTEPVVEYNHSKGCSITGGEVYRGKAIPALAGRYFYADFCTSIVRSFRWSKAGVREHWDWKLPAKPRLSQVSSFGLDHDRELYVVSLAGHIYKLVAQK